jgi:thiol-disulfide isomerase/thioredoxin
MESESVIRNHRGKIFLISSIPFVAVLLYLVLPGKAGADDHFMDALGIMRFDEKIEVSGFSLKNLDGRDIGLNDYRGKIVFLNFWATWCPPCRAEMPSMERLHRKFKDRDLIILAIDVMEREKKVRAFKEEFELSFLILLDSDAKVGLSYAVRSIPTTYLVDRNGFLIGGALGPRDWASETAFELMGSLLNASSPP